MRYTRCQPLRARLDNKSLLYYNWRKRIPRDSIVRAFTLSDVRRGGDGEGLTRWQAQLNTRTDQKPVP